MKKIALHWQIIIGMVLGVAFGVAVSALTFSNELGTIEYEENAPVGSEVIRFAVWNIDKSKNEELACLVSGGAEGNGNFYQTIQIDPSQAGTFDLLKAEDENKYIFKKLIENPEEYSLKPDNQFIVHWVKPFGTIFINLLKLIAVPLILASLIKGVSDLQDISKLSKMGGRTILTYIVTTVVAVSIGLIAVNVLQPGGSISEETRQELMADFGGDASTRIEAAAKQQENGPLQFVIDIVPQNIFSAASDNGNMLQVIFFAIFFGIGLILIEKTKAKPVMAFFDGFNEVILKLVDLIMLASPLGVFALMAALVAESPSSDIFVALGAYGLTVVLGLAILIVFYVTIVYAFTGRKPRTFLNGIAPAQLLAFSTSSSAATLPVTMERVEEHLGVEKEVVSFVLPVGATINMDGTSLYQAVAAVFIAQVFGDDLTLASQLTIVATATLASIGSAAVPGAGILMLIIVLESIGVNPAGVALIFAVDRPLDMCRTVINVTGDAAVSMLIGKSVDKLGDPKVKDWDDNYPPKPETA